MLEELRDLMTDTASDLAQVETDSDKWVMWLALLLESLEAEAKNKPGYESFLAKLQGEIAGRLKAGIW